MVGRQALVQRGCHGYDIRWTCSCCGQSFDTLPIHCAFAAPRNWFGLTEDRRANQAQRLSDQWRDPGAQPFQFARKNQSNLWNGCESGIDLAFIALAWRLAQALTWTSYTPCLFPLSPQPKRAGPATVML